MLEASFQGCQMWKLREMVFVIISLNRSKLNVFPKAFLVFFYLDQIPDGYFNYFQKDWQPELNLKFQGT